MITAVETQVLVDFPKHDTPRVNAGDAVSLRARNVSAPQASSDYVTRNVLLRAVRHSDCNWREAMHSLELQENSIRGGVAAMDTAHRARMILLEQGIAFRKRMGIDASRNLTVDIRAGQLVFSDEEPQEIVPRVSTLYGAYHRDSQKMTWDGMVTL